MKLRRTKDELLEVAGYMVEITQYPPIHGLSNGKDWWMLIDNKPLRTFKTKAEALHYANTEIYRD